MEARGVAHVERDLAGEGGDGAGDVLGDDGSVSHHHEHGHSLTDGAAHAQHHRIDDAQLGRGKHHFIYGLPFGGAHGIARFAHAHGDGAQGVHGEGGDGGHDHDGQHQPGGESAKTQASGEVGQPGAQDYQTKEAIDDRRYASQQVHRRRDDIGEALVGNLGEVDGAANGQRHANNQGAGSDDDGAHQKRHDAVVPGGRRPVHAKEGQQADV